LDYAQRLGYVYAHIWACPPSEGDDYIFHCHPVEQRVPKPKRLQEWYKTMLDIAVQQRVVVDYKVCSNSFHLIDLIACYVRM
jgi:E1A/CREB-binding protein